MRTILAALSFLSILPVGNFLPTEDEMRRMTDFYPAAGLVLGALLWGAGLVFCRYFPPLAAAALLTFFSEALTKGFHLDGLADTADAFLSGRSRERKLEIMHDSRIGTMGVGAIVCCLGLKFACFASLPFALMPAAGGLMMVSGRWGMVCHIAMSRYAREDGLGRICFERKPFFGVVSGLALTAAVGVLFFAPKALAVLGLFPVMFGWSRLTRRVIGGATGDTIGCAEELSEVLTLLMLLLI